MTTAIFLSLIILTLVVSTLFWCVFLTYGLRWAKVTDYTKKRIVLCFILVTIGNLVLQLLHKQFDQPSPQPTYAFEQQPQASPVILEVLFLGFLIIVQVSVICTVFKLDLRQTFKAWLPTLIPGTVIVAYFYLVMRPFIFEMYVVPTNAMSPTILGEHWEGTCSECGAVTFGRPQREGMNRVYNPDVTICENYHLNDAELSPQETIQGDSIVALKFLKPKRWDIIVFQYPIDPSRTHVSRLVGLPGEEVVIDQGSLWIDGKRMTPPEEIASIEYASEGWGTVDRPAQLGEKEYFVLGDFSVWSFDSRLWDTPDYLGDEPDIPLASPFAVPESHLIGVVTHRYWPPSRWAILK